MARAYICLARNDLDNSNLQILDLAPNSSQRNLIYDGAQGETHYVTHYFQNDVVTLAGVGPITTQAAITQGLSAYLVDTVENTGGGAIALTSAELVTITAAIMVRVAGGLSLALADINTAINLPAGVAGSDLNGVLGNSIGTVEQVLRILSGEVYEVPASSAVETAGNAFIATAAGAFATAPDITVDQTTGPGGRNPFNTPAIQRAPIGQTAPESLTFRDPKRVEDTSYLRTSSAVGVLSQLRPATYTFHNPAFNYTAAEVAARPTATRAITCAAANIPGTWVARALTIYTDAGAVITV